jgi:two-component system nitrate/nitrite response regulator NarL
MPERLRAASALPGRGIEVGRQSESIPELLATVARQRPRFAIVDRCWLRDESLGLLEDFRAAHRPTLVAVVAVDLPNLTLAHALRAGLRGLLTPACEPENLRRAIEVMDAGELWISRRRLLEALAAISPPEHDTEPTWRNLPALTDREHAVLREILAGRSNKLIARELDLSEHTVKVHLQHIYQKLGVHRRLDLVRAAGKGS